MYNLNWMNEIEKSRNYKKIDDIIIVYINNLSQKK